MAKRSLPLVGITKRPEFSLDKYPKKREKIRKIIETHYKSKHMKPVDLTEFFSELERAIRWSLFNQALPKYSRANVRKEIEDIRGAETIEEVMEKVPQAVRSWLCTKELSVHRANTSHKVNKVIRLLSARADRELTGQGRDKDAIPVLLAADIANALKKIEIKPVASKPTDSGNPSIFYQLVQECFQIAGLAYKDPYEQLKSALTINISENPIEL